MSSKAVQGKSSKSRSSSIGAREKRLSVFDRLGTKAFPLPANSNDSQSSSGGGRGVCRHAVYHAYCPVCPRPSASTANSSRPSTPTQLPAHSLSSSVKRSSRKEERPEGGEVERSPEVDWTEWDQSELEYEDEKALERRRQLLQRELQLQMNSDSQQPQQSATASSSSAIKQSSKKRSSSSSSCSSSSSVGSSSTSSSDSHKLDKKNFPISAESSTKKSSKTGYKGSISPSRRSVMSKKSPSRKMYKKSQSPNQAASSRKSPSSKRLLSRKKDLVSGRDRSSRQRSISRERRRARSKDVGGSRHRQRRPHTPHSNSRGSERKKDEDRSRRVEERRDRRSTVARDQRREMVGDETRIREKIRGGDKDRCRQQREVGVESRSSRDKCGRNSRSSHQISRAKEPPQSYSTRHSDSARHSPLSPHQYHHHPSSYSRGDRGRYGGGSSEKERVGSGGGNAAYKDLSPRDHQDNQRMRMSSHSHTHSAAGYTDSNRMSMPPNRRRRGGWEDGRYDSPKSSSRDWDPQQTAAERVQEWQRSNKHNQDKEYTGLEKEKEIEWKRSGGTGGVREREVEVDTSSSKRMRLQEDLAPPPPPPPPPINEPDLSDISDDPDDILNRDDVEECADDSRVGDGVETISSKVESSQPASTLSTALSTNMEHRLLDQRIGVDEGLDSPGFEEISDEDLEEDSKNKGPDELGVDWASFIAECRIDKKSSENEGKEASTTSGKPWDFNNIVRRIGLSRQYAGDELFNSVQEKLTQDGGEGLASDVAGIHCGLMRRKQTLSAFFSNKVAICSRSDLALRRKLCGLPAVGMESLHRYQTTV